jgi:hypothetical protein
MENEWVLAAISPEGRPLVGVHNGDRVQVRMFGNPRYEGNVISASYYHPTQWEPKLGWFVEMTEANGEGYRYWKQGPDGGDLFVRKS